jgi:beta-phosphoglucomutase
MVFDFNGVIVDDEPLHCRAFQHTLAERGFTLSREEYYEKFLPYDDYNFCFHFLTDRKQPVGAELISSLMSRKSEHYFAQVQEKIPVIPATTTFIRGLPGDLPLVIASGAARREIEYILTALQLINRFAGIVAAGDVANSKPHPEAFLSAFKILGSRLDNLSQDEVVVFEDSYMGIQAVRSAGLLAVAVTTSYSAERLSAADLVIDNLEDWSLETLQQALAK